MSVSGQFNVRPMRLSDVTAISLWEEKHPESWLSAYHYREHRNHEKQSLWLLCKWFFKRRIPGLRWIYAIEGRDGTLCGYWTLVKKNPFGQRAYLGVAVNPAEVNQGAGTASMPQVLRLAFCELGIQEIWNTVLAVNVRSLRLMRRHGLVQYDSKMVPHDDQSMKEKLLDEYPEYFALENGVLVTRVYYHRLERSRYLEMLKER